LLPLLLSTAAVPAAAAAAAAAVPVAATPAPFQCNFTDVKWHQTVA